MRVVQAVLLGLCRLAAVSATDGSFEDIGDAVALMQVRQLQGEPPQKERAQQVEATASAWEIEAAEAGWHVHRPGTAVLSGAVVWKTAMDILADTFKSNATNASLEVPRERSEEKDSSNKSGMVNGFRVYMTENTSDEGFYYTSEMSPGCREQNEWGDTDCLVEFEKEFTTTSTAFLGTDLGNASRLWFSIQTNIHSPLIPNPEPLEQDCPLCGIPCTINYKGKSITLDQTPCPSEAGPYSLFSDAFTIHDSLALRTVEWDQRIEYRMIHDDGHELFRTVTTVHTVASGVGGGWVSKTI